MKTTMRFLRAPLLAAAFLSLVTAAGAPAQEIKVGYADVDSLIRLMPEYEAAREVLAGENDRLKGELGKMVQELQAQTKLAQEQRASLSEEALREKGAELARMRDGIGEAEQQAERALALKERELLAPLFQRAQAAIKAVAERRSLTLVVRPEALLYVDPATTVDLAADLKAELGIVENQAE